MYFSENSFLPKLPRTQGQIQQQKLFDISHLKFPVSLKT
jgi:hypothetical protein